MSVSKKWHPGELSVKPLVITQSEAERRNPILRCSRSKRHRELLQHREECFRQAFDRHVTRIEAERLAISSYCRKSKQESKRGRDCFDVFWTMHQDWSEAERIDI